MLYRIYTEDCSADTLTKTVSKFVDSFSVFQGIGFYKGTQEKSVVVEIVTDKPEDILINELAQSVKYHLKQEAVLIQKLHNTSWSV